MLDEITILIKSFLREHATKNLINSIRRYYPTIPIIVIDDSEPWLNFDYDKNITTYNLQFDTGLSAGRNYGVNKISTKYFLLLDDDFEFNNRTNLNLMIKILEEHNLDILGGEILSGKKVNNFYGTMKYIEKERTIVCARTFEELHNVKICNLIPNFFLAKTNKIKENPWENYLKMGEHAAFFFNILGKLKIGITESVKIKHCKSKVDDATYSSYRQRSVYYHKLWMKKEKITKIITFDGKEIIAE